MIIACVANEKINPPMLEPAELIPLARLLSLLSHCSKIGMLETETRPTPKPMRTPYER